MQDKGKNIIVIFYSKKENFTRSLAVKIMYGTTFPD